MSDMQELTVVARTLTGKKGARAVRAEGLVPGIYYDAKGEKIPVTAKELPLQRLYNKVGSAHVFTLKIDTNGTVVEKPSFVWDVQHHPVKSRITHVDFYGVDLTKKVRVEVPVKLTGKAPGVVEGGQLEIFRDMIEVECLPLAVPEAVVVDVSSLAINDSVQVADLQLPAGVVAIHDDNYAVVGVVPPAAEAPTASEDAAAATPSA